MKTPLLALLAVTLLSLAGIVVAGDPPNGERLRQFRRDLPLIETLVDEGLVLAAEEDPVKRAQSCNVLAKSIVHEIETAAKQRDQQRTTTLGKLLQAVLVRGVAANLDLARSQLPEDPQRQPELERIGEQMREVTDPVANPSISIPKQIMGPALDAVKKGRVAVDKAIKGK
jgi:hypothetical protein